jgi:hypothetical protein
MFTIVTDFFEIYVAFVRHTNAVSCLGNPGLIGNCSVQVQPQSVGGTCDDSWGW